MSAVVSNAAVRSSVCQSVCLFIFPFRRPHRTRADVAVTQFPLASFGSRTRIFRPVPAKKILLELDRREWEGGTNTQRPFARLVSGSTAVVRVGDFDVALMDLKLHEDGKDMEPCFDSPLKNSKA